MAVEVSLDNLFGVLTRGEVDEKSVALLALRAACVVVESRAIFIDSIATESVRVSSPFLNDLSGWILPVNYEISEASVNIICGNEVTISVVLLTFVELVVAAT